MLDKDVEKMTTQERIYYLGVEEASKYRPRGIRTKFFPFIDPALSAGFQAYEKAAILSGNKGKVKLPKEFINETKSYKPLTSKKLKKKKVKPLTFKKENIKCSNSRKRKMKCTG